MNELEKVEIRNAVKEYLARERRTTDLNRRIVTAQKEQRDALKDVAKKLPGNGLNGKPFGVRIGKVLYWLNNRQGTVEVEPAEIV